MRLAVSLALGTHTLFALHDGVPVGLRLYSVCLDILGALLLVGLWTPIVAGLLALAALGDVIARPEDWRDWRIGVIVAIVAVALALLGPGAWSVDSRLYGWKRLEIPRGNEGDASH